MTHRPSVWWLISDISHCRYLAHDSVTKRETCHAFCRTVTLSPVFVSLSRVLSHCRSVVRFVILSLSRPFLSHCRVFCLTVDLSCVLSYCRYLARLVALLYVVCSRVSYIQLPLSYRFRGIQGIFATLSKRSALFLNPNTYWVKMVSEYCSRSSRKYITPQRRTGIRQHRCFIDKV